MKKKIIIITTGITITMAAVNAGVVIIVFVAITISVIIIKNSLRSL